MNEQTSYCAECDAKPGDCQHTALRYLAPPDYERDDRAGWKVPEHERERWERGPALAATSPRQRTVRPIQELINECEHAMWLPQDVEDQLRAVYQQRPEKVARLAEHAIDGAKDGTLNNPAAFLAKRLRELTPTPDLEPA